MDHMAIVFIVLWRLTRRMLRYLGRGVLLVPVSAMGVALFGVRPWTVLAVLLAVLVAVWRPVVAAGLLPVTMVVAGISGLVVAATESVSGFWAVSVFRQVKLGAVRGPVRRPPAVLKRSVVHGRQVVVNQVAPGGKIAQVLRPAAVPGWPPAGAGAGFTVSAGPGVRFAIPAHATWTAVAGPGGALRITSGSGPGSGGGLWLGDLLVPLALLLLTVGLWLLPRSVAGLRTHAAGLVASVRRRMLENRWGILLIPVALLGLTVFGVHMWTVVAVWLCVVAAVWSPVIAADLIPIGLAAYAIRGFAIAASWPSGLPGLQRAALHYGVVLVNSPQTAMLAGGEASAFLVVAAWLVPRTIGAHAHTLLGPGRDLDLEGRVQRLTETRELAVGAADTELRRIERDLHDGAQARLIALGMNLRAVERMLPGRPDAALALVAEARETSLRALNDLRDLVRGICPPVLADRGLGHAVRALTLDTPFPVDLDIDLPGRLAAPVESACYFAVAEALANAVRHSGARRVHIRMQHRDGVLRIQVGDDGAGGADPARGTGLRGVEQRLAAFDGILAVSSPPGGPTMIAMEVPCALSSPKTCSC